jgi:biopolymer transport protein TolR
MAGMQAAGGGRRGRRRGKRSGPMNEINMTPFIDVVLVLLIIFMVAAPLMTVGVPLDLPKTQAAQLNMDQKPITLSIRSSGQVYLEENELQDGDIISGITARAKRGDKKVDYGRVAQVMAIVTGGGFKRVALVTEPDQK